MVLLINHLAFHARGKPPTVHVGDTPCVVKPWEEVAVIV